MNKYKELLMELPIHQVDAFASDVFEGNPAAVCPLDEWLPDDLMQKIAMENNLAETAFFVGQGDSYRLRWFTPVTEVDLCGHATLASAHVLFEHLDYKQEVIRFDSNSGELRVKKKGELLEMDFPASPLDETEMPPLLEQAMGIPAIELYQAIDYLYVVDSEEQVRGLEPGFQLLEQVNTRGVIVTAPAESDSFDFVSRFFAPAVGVDEDPVTGSAHTMLAPYWSKRLGKSELIGGQVSARGGTVYCQLKGDRVALSGGACTYLKGTILL